MENGWIWESGGSIGVALRDSGGSTLWQLYFNGGDTYYNTPDGVTDIGWTDTGIEIHFTLTAADAFSVEVHPLGGSARQYTGTITNDVYDFRAWSYDNGTDDGQNSNRDFFIDDLLITHETDGSESYSTAMVHIIRESDGSPVIPPIVIDPGTGFSFDVPTGYDLDRVEGADALVGDAWNWATLVENTDYTLNAGELTILTTGAETHRMIRIWLTETP